MTQDEPRMTLEELLGPEAHEDLRARVQAACGRPGEAWVLADIRCKDFGVRHVDISDRHRISAVDKKTRSGALSQR